MGSCDKIKPGFLGDGYSASNHLDDIAIMKGFIKSMNIAIHTETIGMIADISMDMVCEIEGQCPFGKIVNITVGRVNEYPVAEEVDIELVVTDLFAIPQL